MSYLLNSNSNRLESILSITSWLFATAFFLFMALYIMPRKGFDFTDKGYHLYMSWILSMGVVATLGYGEIINALFMKIGFHNYLFYERLYYVFIAFSVTAFWHSFRNIKPSYYLPFVLILTISLQKYTSMLEYHSSPCIFLLLAFATLFYSISLEGGVRRKIFYLVPAFLFVLSIVSNTALFPCIVPVIVVNCFLLRKSSDRKYFFIFLTLFFIAFLLHYLHSPLSLFRANAPRQFGYMYIVERLFLYLLHIIKLCLFALPIVIYRAYAIRNFPRHERIVSVFIFAIVSVFLLTFKYEQHIFEVLTISIVLFMRKSETNYRLACVLIVLLSFCACMGSATLSGFNTTEIYFLPIIVPLIFLTYCLNHTYEPPARAADVSAFAFLMVVSCFGIYKYCDYTYRAFPVFSEKHLIKGSVLSDIYANKSKLQFLTQVDKFYKNNDCENKYFIAYPVMPLLYYMYNRRAPLDQPFTKPLASNLTLHDIKLGMDHYNGYCAIVVPYFDVKANYLASATDFLSRKSKLSEHHNYNISKKTFSKAISPREAFFYSG